MHIDDARELLKQRFGFDDFRRGQADVISALLRGDSAAAVFPTGGGKSLCYQLPALMFDGLTIVVSPLIALMKDQIDALRARGIRASRLDSSLTLDEHREVVARLRDGSLPLLYVAPERFNNERFRELLTGVKLSLFAVDEAHCISEWGHNFRPDYLKLVRFARDYGAERVLALTATATPAVLEDMCAQFEIQSENAVVAPFYRKNLEVRSRAVTVSERDGVLLQRLRDRPPGPTIVYVTRQRTAEEVASWLAREGFEAVPYHAGLSAEKRAHIQDRFMASTAGIVVATIAFGMGVDKRDIRYVYHYNLPKSIESYSQEIGRAGRDGAPSICEALPCGADVHTLENFAHGDTPDASAVEGLVQSLFRLVEAGDRFDVSYFDLAATYDIRLLVVRTLITYLELDGYLEAGTPFYQQYRFKPRMSSKEILASHDGDERSFLKRLLAHSEKKRTWFTIDVEAAMHGLNVPRRTVVAALDALHDGDFIELQSSGMRQPFVVRRVPEAVDDVAKTLVERVHERERRELERLRGAFSLFGGDTCQVNRLSAHFGEHRGTPCGHCTVCLEGPLPVIEAEDAATPVNEAVFHEVRALTESDDRIGRALSTPRAVARFLCGLTSPLTSRARLTKQPLFGALSRHRFSRVLELSSQLS